jgi:hypothetical protein
MKFIFTLLALISLSSHATTWDEPWQKEIIENAEFFVLAEILSCDKEKGLEIKLIKTFGASLEGSLIIDDFFMLDICSSTGGQKPEFHFLAGSQGYFFLKKSDHGSYAIPTPTAGFDRIYEGEVIATYRHTYHQASISPELYELTYSEIWNYYHKSAYSNDKIMTFVEEQIAIEPASLVETESVLFFKQHAALETIFLLDIEIDFLSLKPFAESEEFHASISGLRAMKNCDVKEAGIFLMNFVLDSKHDNFRKVIAIESLWEICTLKQKKKIWNNRTYLSEDSEGFGGNIMDPRVCTHFPSPRSAVERLYKTNANSK